jgi:hypothetical protein
MSEGSLGEQARFIPNEWTEEPRMTFIALALLVILIDVLALRYGVDSRNLDDGGKQLR